MLQRFTALALAAAVFVVAGCDDDNGVGPTQQAEIRVINASADNQSIDLFAGNNRIAQGLAFNAGSAQCIRVDAGTPTLTFRPAGGATDIATISQPLTGNTNYTLILMGDNSAQLLTDQFTAPGTGQARIRFINAATNAGAVDIYASAPGSDAFGATPTAANLNVSGTSQFLDVPETNTRLRFTAAGTTNVLFEVPTLTWPSSRVSTVVFTQDAQDAFGFASVEPCD